MRKILLAIPILISLFMNYAKAQMICDFNLVMDSIEKQNNRLDTLSNGFYLVQSKNNWIFSNWDNIQSNSNWDIKTDTIVVDSKVYEKREIMDYRVEYFIVTRPIALFNNIMRIYDYKNCGKDCYANAINHSYLDYSKGAIQGLIFNFNNIDTSKLCEMKDVTRKSFLIGLIYNDSLICVSDLYDFKFIKDHKSVRFPFDDKYENLKYHILETIKPRNYKIIK